MAAIITLENAVESYEVIEDFTEVVNKINHHLQTGMQFIVLSKTDGRPLGFAIPNLVAIEGVGE